MAPTFSYEHNPFIQQVNGWCIGCNGHLVTHYVLEKPTKWLLFSRLTIIWKFEYTKNTILDISSLMSQTTQVATTVLEYFDIWRSSFPLLCEDSTHFFSHFCQPHLKFWCSDPEHNMFGTRSNTRSDRLHQKIQTKCCVWAMPPPIKQQKMTRDPKPTHADGQWIALVCVHAVVVRRTHFLIPSEAEESQWRFVQAVEFISCLRRGD